MPSKCSLWKGLVGAYELMHILRSNLWLIVSSVAYNLQVIRKNLHVFPIRAVVGRQCDFLLAYYNMYLVVRM